MRFYNLRLFNPTTGANILPSSLGGNAITSLLPNGNFNPAALNVAFDIPVSTPSTPDNGAWISVQGLGLRDIGAALDLAGMSVQFSAGMSSGLPLANPKQQGLIIAGSIWQPFGNWIGTNQTLELHVAAGGTSDKPAFPFTWKAGTQLSTAIGQTLSTAMPNVKQNIQISKNLIIGYDETGYYETLEQFSGWLTARTKPIIGGTYQGVRVALNGSTVSVWDGTVQPEANKVKQIAFQDLIGQPTWIGFGLISVTFVLRGDLSVGDKVQMPSTLYTLTLPSSPRFQDKSSFTGKFEIRMLHHYGNFRQSDAASWTTVAEALQVR